MKLPIKVYDKLKELFEMDWAYANFNSEVHFLEPSHLQKLNLVLVGLEYWNKINEAQIEYLKLLQFKPGDSFENHFQPEEYSYYFYNPENYTWLANLPDEQEPSMLLHRLVKGKVKKFTITEVERAGFDIDKFERRKEVHFGITIDNC